VVVPGRAVVVPGRAVVVVPGRAVGAQERTEHDDLEGRKNQPDSEVNEAIGHADQLFVLAEPAIDWSDVPGNRDEDEGDQYAGPDALAQGAPHRAVVAGAERLRHHRRNGLDDAHAEQLQRDEQRAGEGGGGEIFGPQPAEHDDVGGVERDLRQLRHHQRPAEREQGPELGAPAMRRQRFCRAGDRRCRFRIHR